MNRNELLKEIKNDLKTCKPNKRLSLNLIEIMLHNMKNKQIETQYNLGCIAEAVVKSYFIEDVAKSSPKGENDLNIEISQKHLNKYFNGVATKDIDIKYINNYSSAHKPLESKYLVCITPKGCYMIHSDNVEYNDNSKIILSSVYKNALRLKNLEKLLGL